MKVSTRGDYAARALLSLALHGSERPTSVKEIAERTGLPQPYLEQILLAIKGAGLVRSKRGVGGGYVLARPPGEITLAPTVVFGGIRHPYLSIAGWQVVSQHRTSSDGKVAASKAAPLRKAIADLTKRVTVLE